VFLRNKNGGGLVSRYSAFVQILYPMPPLAPQLGHADTRDPFNPVFTFILDGADDPLNVYGIEVRDSDNSTILLQQPVIGPADLVFDYDNSTTKKASFSFYVYFYNLLAEYSSALIVTDTAGYVTQESLGKNMIGNPGIELSSLSYANPFSVADGRYVSDGWVASIAGTITGQMLLEVNAGPRTGAYALLSRLTTGISIANGTTAYGIFSYPVDRADAVHGIPVRGGDTVLFGGYAEWFSAAGSLPSGVTGAIYFQVIFWTNSGVLVSASQTTKVTSATGVYTYLDGTEAVPSTAAFVTFEAVAQVTNGSGSTFNTSSNLYQDARFDDVFLEKATRGGHATYRPTTNPLTATDAGSYPNIIVTDFVMRSGDTDLSVTGASPAISGAAGGLAYNTLYYVYYDDPAFSGGSVTYHATVTKEIVLVNENRFFVGSIKTPKATANDSVGNNDGGAGAQIGILSGTFEMDSIYSQAVTGNGSITNASKAIDGTDADYATLQVDGDSANNTATLILASGAPPIAAAGASLNFQVAIPTNSIDGVLVGNAYKFGALWSSNGGGGTYAQLFNPSAPGHGPVVPTVQKGVTYDEILVIVPIPDGLDLSQIAVKFVLNTTGSGIPDTTGSLIVNVFRAWLTV
jgi:hypothetical protein